MKHVVLVTILDAVDNVRLASAACVGAMCCAMVHSSAAASAAEGGPRSQVMDCVVDLAGGGTPNEPWTGAAGRYHGAAMALQSLGCAITAAGTAPVLPAAITTATEEIRQDIFLFLQTGLQDSRAAIRLAACR